MGPAGDVNQDTIGDMIVGSTAVGAYIIYGSSSRTSDISLASFGSSDGWRITDSSGSNKLGSSVSGTGDINYDQVLDLIIGDPSQPSEGAAYLISYRFGVVCSPHCQSCQAPLTCDVCKPGYTLSGSSCNPIVPPPVSPPGTPGGPNIPPAKSSSKNLFFNF